MYDQGYSALIEDLSQRGMLDQTLVCNLAEFGRTPEDQSGRRTRPLAAMLDGLLCRRRRAGRPGGRQKRRDRRLSVERPVKPAEIVATIYHSLGSNLETHLARARTDGPSRLVDYGTQPIMELF